MAAYHLQTKNKLSEMADIYSALRNFLEENGMLNNDHYNECCQCIDEVFSNVVNYAYQDTKEHLIDIGFKCNLEEETVEITISDDGVEFNPLADAKNPDLTLDIEERGIGGLGIFLVKSIMSRTEYQRKHNKNIFLMSKSFKQ